MKLPVHYRNTITVCPYNLWTLLLMTYSPRAITTRNSCERVKQHLYINTKSEALKWLDKCPCVEQQTSTLLLAAHRPIWRVVCSSFTWQKMLPFYGWQHIYSEHTRTSCHSTDSKMPHGCHHLQNNFGLHRILPILHNGPRDAPQNCTFPCGESRPSPSTLFFFLESTPQTGSSAAHCCDRRTHTQTTLHL